jgi:hypothetical protein
MTDEKLTFGTFIGRTLRSLLNTKRGVDYVRWLANGEHHLSAIWRQRAKDALKKARL